MQRVVWWDVGASLFGPKEINSLPLPPDKASTVMTDYLLTGLSCLGKVVQVESYIHKPKWLSWVVILTHFLVVMTSSFWVKSHKIRATSRHDYGYFLNVKHKLKQITQNKYSRNI